MIIRKNSLLFILLCTFCMVLLVILAATNAERPETYSNPVLVETVVISRSEPDNFSGVLGIGDPAVIFHAGSYYLYPTGDNRGYDVYISPDLVNWRKGPRIFTASEPGVWAPDVFYNENDQMFYLYYTVNGRIGVASADRPDGQFRDVGSLIDRAIDAHMFQDSDGSYYLFYVEYPGFRIHVQPMASPTLKKGNPVELIHATEGWERNIAAITEAPWMVKHDNVYYLLYSGGGADSQEYAIGYATAVSPLGPFSKYEHNPIVKKDGSVFGPGHCSVTKSPDGQLWMIYHQQKNNRRGWNRIICLDPLWFDSQGILHGKATRGTEQAWPGTFRKSGDG